MHQIGRPVPKSSRYVDTEPFWAGMRQKKLFLQFCKDTGSFQHYPRPVSIYTGSRNLEWREVSGKGTIYASSTLRVGRPDLATRLPLPIATIELTEQVRIVANILDSASDDIRIGQSVTLVWDRLDDEMPYPAFTVS